MNSQIGNWPHVAKGQGPSEVQKPRCRNLVSADNYNRMRINITRPTKLPFNYFLLFRVAKNCHGVSISNHPVPLLLAPHYISCISKANKPISFGVWFSESNFLVLAECFLLASRATAISFPLSLGRLRNPKRGTRPSLSSALMPFRILGTAKNHFSRSRDLRDGTYSHGSTLRNSKVAHLQGARNL